MDRDVSKVAESTRSVARLLFRRHPRLTSRTTITEWVISVHRTEWISTAITLPTISTISRLETRLV